MKLRGLPVYIAIIAVAAALPLVFDYLQNRNSPYVNDIKSHLTDSNSSQSAPKKLVNIIADNLKNQSAMTERSDFNNENLLEKERFYTESEISNMSEAQFAELLKTTELKLPKLSDLKELPPGALHHTPPPVMQAGKDLGLLKEVLKVHESYESLALGFYEKCAKATDRPTPVRALCLTNLVEIKKKKGEKINIKQYPAQLVELTRMITDI
jgi:hypothetical protein